MSLPASRLQEFLVESVANGFNARQDLDITPEFQESINTRGVLTPPWLTEDGRTIAGARRIEAARRAGLKTIWVRVFDNLSDGQITSLGLLENLARKDLTHYETLLGLQRLREACPDMKQKDIAKGAGLSEGMISQYFALDRLCPEGMEAFKANKLPVTKAYAVATSPDQLATLALFLKGTTRSEANRKARTAKAEKTDTEKTEKVPVALNNGRVIIMAKKGEEALNLTAARVLLVDALAKVDKAIDIGYSVRTAVNAWDETKHKVNKPRKPRAAKGTA